MIRLLPTWLRRQLGSGGKSGVSADQRRAAHAETELSARANVLLGAALVGVRQAWAAWKTAMQQVSGSGRRRPMSFRPFLCETIEPRLLFTTLYWDTSSAAGLQGGDGTWSTTEVNWNTAADGSGQRVAWTDGDEAVFSANNQGNNALVSISDGVTANSVAFNSSGYYVSGSTLTLSGAATVFAVDGSGIYANIVGNAHLSGHTFTTGTVTGNATFDDSSLNNGYIHGNAVFNDHSINLSSDGEVSGDAAFNDTSANWGIVGGDAVFAYASGGTAVLSGDMTWGGWVRGATLGSDGIAIDHWIFDDNSSLVFAGSISGDVTFNDSSYVQAGGNASGNVIFNDSSRNDGYVWGSPIFNNSSGNSFTIGGHATFNGSTYNHGNIWGDAIFNDDSTNSGTVFFDQDVDLSGRTLSGGTFDITEGVTATNNGGLVIGNATLTNDGTLVWLDADRSQLSSVVNNGTILFPPAAPGDVSATALSPSQVLVEWTDNSDNESSFSIERSTDGVNWTYLNAVQADDTSFLDLSAEPATTYVYRVRSTNGVAHSDWAESGAMTTPLPPVAIVGAPTDARAGDTVVLVADVQDFAAEDALIGAWTVTKNGESFAEGNGLMFGFSSTSAGDYLVSVTVANDAGQSTSDSTTISVLPPLPAAPSNLIATAISPTQIDLTWEDNSDIEDSYRVYISDDGANFTPLAVLPANTTAYSATGLTSGGYYVFDVRAANSDGSSPSAPSDDTVTTPNLSVSLDPLDPQHAMVLTYSGTAGVHLELEMKGPDDDNYHLAADLGTPTNGETHTYEASGLLGDTAYAFRLRADRNGLVAYANGTQTTAAEDDGYDDFENLITPPTFVSSTLLYESSYSWNDIVFDGPYAPQEDGSPGSQYFIFVMPTRRSGDSYGVLDGFHQSGAVWYEGDSHWHVEVINDSTGVAVRGRIFISSSSEDPYNNLLAVSEPFEYTTHGDPVDPVEISATPGENGDVVLSWDASGSVNGGIYAGIVPYAVVGDDAVLLNPETTTMVSDESLTVHPPVGATKIFTVVATTGYDDPLNRHQFSNYSNFVDAHGDNSEDGLAAPANLTATLDRKDATKVHLLWDNISNNEDHFDIQRSTNGALSWETVATTQADKTTFDATITDLSTEGIIFRILAVAKGGATSQPSNPATAPTIVTVHYWKPHGPVTNPAFGHVSMTLADGTYISWWPKDHGKLVSDADKDRIQAKDQDQEGVAVQDFEIAGLDQKKIEDWWDDFRAHNTKWIFPTQDCATVVEDALRTGGAAVPANDAATPIQLLPILETLDRRHPTTQP